MAAVTVKTGTSSGTTVTTNAKIPAKAVTVKTGTTTTGSTVKTNAKIPS